MTTVIITSQSKSSGSSESVVVSIPSMKHLTQSGSVHPLSKAKAPFNLAVMSGYGQPKPYFLDKKYVANSQRSLHLISSAFTAVEIV